MIDALHLRREAPYETSFIPVRVPSVTEPTVGLWLMDEEDRSRIAHDSACNHHGTVDELSFADDFPG